MYIHKLEIKIYMHKRNLTWPSLHQKNSRMFREIRSCLSNFSLNSFKKWNAHSVPWHDVISLWIRNQLWLTVVRHNTVTGHWKVSLLSSLLHDIHSQGTQILRRTFNHFQNYTSFQQHKTVPKFASNRLLFNPELIFRYNCITCKHIISLIL